MKRVAFIFSSAPHGSAAGREGLLTDSGAGGVEVLRQLFDRAFALRLQVLENGCLALTWFHKRCILRLKFRNDNFARY